MQNQWESLLTSLLPRVLLSALCFSAWRDAPAACRRATAAEAQACRRTPPPAEAQAAAFLLHIPQIMILQQCRPGLLHTRTPLQKHLIIKDTSNIIGYISGICYKIDKCFQRAAFTSLSRYWLEVVINKIIDKYCLGLTHPDKTEAIGASKRPNTKTN